MAWNNIKYNMNLKTMHLKFILSQYPNVLLFTEDNFKKEQSRWVGISVFQFDKCQDWCLLKFGVYEEKMFHESILQPITFHLYYYIKWFGIKCWGGRIFSFCFSKLW